MMQVEGDQISDRKDKIRQALEDSKTNMLH